MLKKVSLLLFCLLLVSPVFSADETQVTKQIIKIYDEDLNLVHEKTCFSEECTINFNQICDINYMVITKTYHDPVPYAGSPEGCDCYGNNPVHCSGGCSLMDNPVTRTYFIKLNCPRTCEECTNAGLEWCDTGDPDTSECLDSCVAGGAAGGKCCVAGRVFNSMAITGRVAGPGVGPGITPPPGTICKPCNASITSEADCDSLYGAEWYYVPCNFTIADFEPDEIWTGAGSADTTYYKEGLQGRRMAVHSSDTNHAISIDLSDKDNFGIWMYVSNIDRFKNSILYYKCTGGWRTKNIKASDVTTGWNHITWTKSDMGTTSGTPTDWKVVNLRIRTYFVDDDPQGEFVTYDDWTYSTIGGNCAGTCITKPEDCPVGVCSDGLDNEGLNEPNGCIDGIDAACGGTEAICDDAIDNDCDGLTDCDDSDCSSDPACGGPGAGNIIVFMKYPDVDNGLVSVADCGSLDKCNNPYKRCTADEYINMIKRNQQDYGDMSSKEYEELMNQRMTGKITGFAVSGMVDIIGNFTRSELVYFLANADYESGGLVRHCNEEKCEAFYHVENEDSLPVYPLSGPEQLVWNGFEQAWSGYVDTAAKDDFGKAIFGCEKVYTLVVNVTVPDVGWAVNRTDFYINCIPKLSARPRKVSLVLGEGEKRIFNVTMFNPTEREQYYELTMDAKAPLISWIKFENDPENDRKVNFTVPVIDRHSSYVDITTAGASGSYPVFFEATNKTETYKDEGEINIFSESIREFELVEYSGLLAAVMIILVKVL